MLLIEVADIAIDYDHDVKFPLYAQVEIPETWIANLTDNWVDQYTSPSVAGYQLRARFLPGQTVAFQNVEMAVSEILGLPEGTNYTQ